jgi:hypothetical protein
VGRPATTSTPPAYTDNRRSERVSVNSRMMLILQSDARRSSHKVRTVDISKFGIRIRLGGALVPGQTVDLVPAEAEGSWNTYPCRVVWSSHGTELFSDAGLEFKTPWMTVKPAAGA